MLKNIKNGGYCTIAELGLSTYSLALFSFHSWLPVRKKILWSLSNHFVQPLAERKNRMQQRTSERGGWGCNLQFDSYKLHHK